MLQKQYSMIFCKYNKLVPLKYLRNYVRYYIIFKNKKGNPRTFYALLPKKYCFSNIFRPGKSIDEFQVLSSP